jgi:hypothetical protein
MRELLLQASSSLSRWIDPHFWWPTAVRMWHADASTDATASQFLNHFLRQTTCREVHGARVYRPLNPDQKIHALAGYSFPRLILDLDRSKVLGRSKALQPQDVKLRRKKMCMRAELA